MASLGTIAMLDECKLLRKAPGCIGESSGTEIGRNQPSAYIGGEQCGRLTKVMGPNGGIMVRISGQAKAGLCSTPESGNGDYSKLCI